MVSAETEKHDVAHEDGPNGAARVRTCVGCGERVEIPRSGGALPSDLVRLVLGPSGEVAVDAASGGFGRGAHVHARRACVAKAAQRGLSRAARGKVSLLWVDDEENGAEALASSGGSAGGKLVPLEPEALARAIVRALDRRAQGLVIAAARARKVALGADAVEGAEGRGEAFLIVVATDAAAGADLAAVRRAIAAGRAVAWGSKKTLAGLCSAADSSKRIEGLAVVAIKDDRIAAALRAVVQSTAGLVAEAPGSSDPRPARGSGATHAKSAFEGAAAGHKRHDVGSARALAGPRGSTAFGRARSGRDRRADG